MGKGQFLTDVLDFTIFCEMGIVFFLLKNVLTKL